MSDVTGRHLGPYELLDVVRRGRTSTTYGGRLNDRPVVVTVFEPADDRGILDALLQEVRAVANLRHPNIASIEDSGEQDGQVFFVEERRLTQTLADLPREGLDPGGAVGVVTAVLAGLGHAHSSGVIHQNVTPRHVAIAPPFRPVLTDFGFGRRLLLTGSGSSPRMVLGTPAYLAPEQAFGLPADLRSDLYSTGVVLFELLTGHAPFESDDAEWVLRQQATRPPPSLRQLRPELPESLDRVIARVLAKDPDVRQQNAAELIADLSAAVSRTEGDQAQGGMTADYAAGVKAFSEGRWDDAVRLLASVADADPDYEDVEDLLSAAEAALGAAPDG